MPNSVRSARAISTAERRAQVVQMRRSRASFDEIPKTQVEEHLAEELQLVDDAIADLLKIARDHSRPRNAVEAWNAIARYIELEARLLDLFPAAKSRVHVITEDMVQAEIDRLSAEIARKGAEIPSGPGTFALPRGEWEAVPDPAPGGYEQQATVASREA